MAGFRLSRVGRNRACRGSKPEANNGRHSVVISRVPSWAFGVGTHPVINELERLSENCSLFFFFFLPPLRRKKEKNYLNRDIIAISYIIILAEI